MKKYFKIMILTIVLISFFSCKKSNEIIKFRLSRTAEILTYYKARFQMEFVFRDGKQFVGVNNCEARSEKKLISM